MTTFIKRSLIDEEQLRQEWKCPWASGRGFSCSSKVWWRTSSGRGWLRRGSEWTRSQRARPERATARTTARQRSICLPATFWWIRKPFTVCAAPKTAARPGMSLSVAWWAVRLENRPLPRTRSANSAAASSVDGLWWTPQWPDRFLEVKKISAIFRFCSFTCYLHLPKTIVKMIAKMIRASTTSLKWNISSKLKFLRTEQFVIVCVCECENVNQPIAACCE